MECGSCRTSRRPSKTLHWIRNPFLFSIERPDAAIRRRTVDNGVVVEPQTLVDPVEVFFRVDAAAAKNELMGGPVAGGLTEAPQFQIVKTAEFRIDIGNTVDAIADVGNARPE